MSDISGISFGQMFPSAGVPANMSAGQASAGYAWPVAYSQNNLNNLFATTQASLNANAQRMVDWARSPAAGAWGAGAGSGSWDNGDSYYWGGGTGGVFDQRNAGGGSPYSTFGGAYQNPAGVPTLDFSGGSMGNSFFGGGMNFPTPQVSSPYSGGGIDWSGVGRAAQSLYPGSGSSGLAGFGSDINPFAGLSQQQPQIDWGGMFGGAPGGSRQDPYPGMSMPGGLNSPMTAQEPAYDYGSLYKGSRAQADPYQADPYPGMAGLGGGSPMTAQQQPPIDFGSLFGQAVGGTAGGQPRGASVFDTGTAPVAGTEDTTRYGGGFGIDTDKFEQPHTAPATPQYPSTGPAATEAYNPYFDVTSPSSERSGGELVGPGGGLSAADMGEQARQRLAELMSPAVEGEAGRSGMLGRPDTAEAAADERVPLPQARPEDADVPRPEVALGTTTRDLGYLPGRSAQDLKGVDPRVTKALKEFSQLYNASQDQYDLVLRSGLRSVGQGFHTSGKAVDLNLVDRRNGERLTDYQTRDPVVFRAYQDQANQFHQFLQKNYPDLAAQHRWGGYFWDGGPGNYGSQDIMHHDFGGTSMAGGGWNEGLGQQSADAYGLPYGGGLRTPYPQFNFDWSNAPIPDVGPMPLTYKSPDGTSVYQIDPTTGAHVNVPIISSKNPSELASRDFVPAAPAAAGEAPAGGEAPATEQIPLPPERPAEAPARESPVNRGQDITPPPANIPNVPAGPSGVEKAQTFLNRSVESILRQYSPENLGKAGWVMDIRQPMREALNGPWGGQILSGLQPKLGELGLKRADFDKAVADPRARFGGGFGGDEFSGQLPSPGAFYNYPGFRQQGEDVESRIFEPSGRDQLARLQASSEPLPEVASTQLGRDLGLESRDLQEPAPTPLALDLGWNDLGREPTSMLPQQPAEPASEFPGEAGRGGYLNRPAVRMDFGGFSPGPEPRQGGVGPEVELTPEHMQTMKQIESGNNPNERTGSYKGLYQLSDREFRDYGGKGSIYDPAENTRIAGLKMTREGQRAQDILGRALTPVEQYLVHQQGLAGTLSHLRNPDQPAWKSWQDAAGSSEARAKAAVWGNLSDNQKAMFDNDVNKLTSRDFLNLWKDKYLEKQVESGQPLIFQRGFSRD